MKSCIQISRGIESLFGTRDENIRLLEDGLKLRTRLLDGDSLEIEGEEAQVRRAERILADYADLVREGHAFNNGDLNSYMRVCTADPGFRCAAWSKAASRGPSARKYWRPKQSTSAVTSTPSSTTI